MLDLLREKGAIAWLPANKFLAICHFYIPTPMKDPLLLLLLLNSFFCCAQTPSDSTYTGRKVPKITWNGAIDVYYANDFNKPISNERPGFLFNHKRHNEINLNLGLVQMAVEGGNYRANLGLMAGTYAQYNLAEEQDLLKNIFQASVGVALNHTQTLWFDAGIIPSHIGFESAISTENLTLTRSLMAENSPYFLTGAKLTWGKGPWEIAGLVVNGWQRIQRVPGNSLPGFGTQVAYAPSDAVSLNFSTFIGTDDPDDFRRMRYFTNLFGKFLLSEQLSLISGLDFGFQQSAKGSSDYHFWFTPAIIAQYKLNSTTALSGRLEYYQDKEGVIVGAVGSNSFQCLGYSVGFDRAVNPWVLLRLEARTFQNQDGAYFIRETTAVRHNTCLTTSLAIRLP